ncbi:VTT domain-containing protein [Akkermansiaceae bacterium]|nr:VTT domain-containing protein [Akkermansiaceae bacterium]
MRLIGLMLLLCALFLLGWMLFGAGLEQAWSGEVLVARFEESRDWAWLAGIGLLLADLLLPIPGTVVMSALGAVYGFWLGGFFATAGSMLAGMLGYGVGRFFKEGFSRKWLGEKDFEKGRRLFDRNGALVVAVSRALPILPEVLACMAGLLRMPFGKFCLALACGAVPMGFLFAWIGTVGRENPGWGLALSLGLPAFLWITANHFRKSDY